MKAYLDQMYANGRTSKGMRLLMAAITDRALRDAAGREPHCDSFEAAKAVWFINGDFCREICLEVNVNYTDLVAKAAKLYRRRVEKESLAGIYHGIPKAGRRVLI